MSVYEGSPTATLLCQSALTASGANAATFSCALTASQLAAGTYSSVDAVFAPGGPSSSNPGFTYTASTSTPTQSFTVNPAAEPTTTSLSAVTSPITFGAETTETFTGTVTGQSGDGNPEGTVSVHYGSPTTTSLCTEHPDGERRQRRPFSCCAHGQQLTLGTYTSVDAVFSPAGPRRRTRTSPTRARRRPRPRASR